MQIYSQNHMSSTIDETLKQTFSVHSHFLLEKHEMSSSLVLVWLCIKHNHYSYIFVLCLMYILKTHFSE